MNKFIYVMSSEDKEKLQNLGFILLKSDEQNSVYIFEANGKMVFLDNDIEYVYSDTLTF